MKLRTKLNRLSLIAAFTLAILLSLAISLLIQNYAEEQARVQGRTVVAMAKVGLLHSMEEQMGSAKNDVDISRIQNEINRLFNGFSAIPELIEMRVLRGKSVERQFGAGGIENQPIEEIEKEMLSSGKTSESLQTNPDGTRVFHFNGPLIASSHGRINCMHCHDASEGEVLGGLSVQIDMSKADAAVSQAIYGVIALLVLVGLVFAIGLQRILMPMVKMVTRITTVFNQAVHGDFSQRLAYAGHDEIGEIAESTNHLMESLDTHIGAIAHDVEGLTGTAFQDSEKEPMPHIAMIVHNLTSAVRFKEEIEADRDLEEVYAHFGRLLRNDFGLQQFSLYEVSANKNSSTLVLSQGIPEGFDNWCNSDGMSDAESCRAKRTVRMVDSRPDPEVCASFCGNCDKQLKHLRHICIPVQNSEGDGIILQIVFAAVEADKISKKASLLQYYLRIAAPEIEAKRLMHTLRESTMRDPLTGLYNRRFLEEFSGNLESSVARRQTTVGVLMCDIDHFKQVNDTRGHGVGDTVLKKVASIFQDVCRASDLVVRYGGEEIVALLMDSEQTDTLDVAERLRQHIEKHTMHDGKDTFHVTISIGTATYPNDNGKLGECIRQADTALYQAKESGRNQVITSQPTSSQVIQLKS